MQEREKDLFQGYEIKNWNFTPRIYKILAAASIFNLLALFVVGQANLLTTRGCDSPMVSRVCQVLDTIYVGSVLLGADRGYVDKDYIKTDLGDAEITYLDLTGIDAPLAYPEGYFEIANPGQNNFDAIPNADGDFSTMNSTTSAFPGIPGFPTNPTLGGADLMNTAPVTPTPNNNAIQGQIPTTPFISSDNNPIAKNRPLRDRKYPRNVKPPPSKNNPTLRNDSPSKLPEFPGDTTAENKTEEKKNEPEPELKSDSVDGIEINKRPIKDLGVFVSGLVNDEKVKLNLETPFTVKAKGKLTKEGKFDPKSFKIQADSADKNMVEVVQQSIEAVNAAGYLKYLEMLSGKDLELLLMQDSENLTAVVQSEMESDTRARTIQSGLNAMIGYSKSKKTDPNDKDDLEILNSASVVTDGKKLIIKFEIKKPLAQEMIKRKLLEQATKGELNQIENGNTSLRTAK